MKAIFVVAKEKGAIKHQVVHGYITDSGNLFFGEHFVRNAKNVKCHVGQDYEAFFFVDREDAVQFLLNVTMGKEEWNWEALADRYSNRLPDKMPC